MKNKKKTLLGLLCAISTISGICALSINNKKYSAYADDLPTTYQMVIPHEKNATGSSSHYHYTDLGNPIKFYHITSYNDYIGIQLYNLEPFSNVEKIQLHVTEDYRFSSSASIKFAFGNEKYGDWDETLSYTGASVGKKDEYIEIVNYREGKKYFYCSFGSKLMTCTDKIIITYSC